MLLPVLCGKQIWDRTEVIRHAIYYGHEEVTWYMYMYGVMLIRIEMIFSIGSKIRHFFRMAKYSSGHISW